MLRIQIDTEIARSAEDVFAFIANPENNPRWQRGMQSCVVTSEGAIGKGTTYAQVASFLGRRIESEFEVVDHRPGHSITGTSVAGSFPITFTRSVEPVGPDRTHVTAIVEGDASGFFRLAAPLLRVLVRTSVAGDYRRLKRLLEQKTLSSSNDI